MSAYGTKRQFAAAHRFGRYRGKADVRRSCAPTRRGADDPGCVKTHTSWRCRKCNSQGSDRAASAQHDLALIMRNHFAIFYAPSKRACFYTAKTRSGRRTSMVGDVDGRQLLRQGDRILVLDAHARRFRGVPHVIYPTSTDGIQLDVGELAALRLLHSTDHDTSPSLF